MKKGKGREGREGERGGEREIEKRGKVEKGKRKGRLGDKRPFNIKVRNRWSDGEKDIYKKREREKTERERDCLRENKQK